MSTSQMSTSQSILSVFKPHRWSRNHPFPVRALQHQLNTHNTQLCFLQNNTAQFTPVCRQRWSPRFPVCRQGWPPIPPQYPGCRQDRQPILPSLTLYVDRVDLTGTTTPPTPTNPVCIQGWPPIPPQLTLFVDWGDHPHHLYSSLFGDRDNNLHQLNSPCLWTGVTTRIIVIHPVCRLQTICTTLIHPVGTQGWLPIPCWLTLVCRQG